MTTNTFVYLSVRDPQCPMLLEAITDMDYFPHFVYRGNDFQVYRIEDFTDEDCTYLTLMVPGVEFWSAERVKESHFKTDWYDQ